MQQSIGEVSFTEHFGVLHDKGFSIEDCHLNLLTDHEIFNRYKSRRHSRYAPRETIVNYEDLKPRGLCSAYRSWNWSF